MNMNQICRCCLVLDVPLMSIYDGVSVGMGCVADLLKQIAKLMPHPADNMPDKACLQCISEINRCFVFKMKCENSNRTLRQLLPEAVPESLDVKPKTLTVVSSSAQTDYKVLVSSLVQTEVEEKPFIHHSSVQTVMPNVNHKEIQTDNEENIYIYEEMENSSEKSEKRVAQCSPQSDQICKKSCLRSSKTNNFLTAENPQSSVEQSAAYLLLEDSNCSEETEMYTQTTIENPNYSETDRFEYYDTEIDEVADGEQENLKYDSEDFKIDNVYESESLEGKTKSDEEAEAIIKPRSNNKSKPKGQYKCSQCIMTFVSMKVLKRHLAKRHEVKDAELIIDYLPSSDCDKLSKDNSSDNPRKLYKSIEELTPENVAKPKLTPRGKTTSTVNEEMLTNIKYFCNNCQAGFAQRKTLTIHIKRRVCMTNNFKCEICAGIFVSEKKLETHKLTHENSHKCLECDTMCKTIEELSQHMIENHNRSARNQCNVCKKVFTMKASLNDHLRIHSGEKPFLCKICGKSFSQNSNLRQHLIRHTNEKNFKCDMCPNAYVTKAELFSHKRTHTGDHPYKCDICQARFTTACSLKKHFRKHTGERPYACECCAMRFTSLNVLKNHRRIHTGEKPYKCVHCPKAFTQKGDCVMHERTHLNNYFKCFCDSKFSKKSNLTYHIKTQHPDYSEKELQVLLDKSLSDNDNAEYQITLMENTENENTEDDNNEELLEIVMGDASVL